MRKLIGFLIFIPFFTFAQFGQASLDNPVHWKTTVEKTGEDTYNLILEADIDKDWHLYSQFTDPDGSLPIEFDWKNKEGNYEVIGKAKEIGTHKKYNEVFGVTETFFTDHAKLIQPVKLLNKNLKKIDLTLYGQACKEACIQIKENFTFDLTKAKKAIVPIKKKRRSKN